MASSVPERASSRTPQPRSGSHQSHHGHSHGHGHAHRPIRRSVSRSSSSPSPPPEPVPSSSGMGRDKRRSSNLGRPGRPARVQPAVLIPPDGSSYLNSTSLPWGSPAEASGSQLDDAGFSTTYGASASSPGARSESERENDYLDGGNGAETDRRETKRPSWDGQGSEGQQGEAPNRMSTPPLNAGRTSFSSRRPPISSTHLPNRPVLLPWRLWPLSDRKGKTPITRFGVSLTRRNCEDALLLGALLLGVWKLGATWHEKALAGEISLLIGLSVIYKIVRRRPNLGRSPPHRPGSPTMVNPSNGHGHLGGHVRERSGRSSHSQGTSGFLATSTADSRRTLGSVTEEDEGGGGISGPVGCIWGTEEREYRECLDDGVLFALLLGPLVATAMLHGSLLFISSSPESATPKGWRIEAPLILPSTPLRQLPNLTFPPTDITRALSALITSRRNLVQLFTLCSFVLLVQLAWSLRLDHKLAKTTPASPLSHTSSLMERDSSDGARPHPASLGIYWLKRGEWRRNTRVVGFAFLVTGGCVIVKIATAYIGRGVWSDMSPSDIVIATLFYQFSLYVCIRLARRGFTLGELVVVCQAATALFMEAVNLTRMKIRFLRTPYIKTYRLPTPLLIFQLALIPGSLLTGFLLSPLLYLSRHLAQKPARRLRFPHEKPMHRRLLALGFYGGAALICGGLLGMWTKWCLDWRNPFVWVVLYLLEGKRAWTRPALLAYWGGLAMISVAGWSRQLGRARRHKRYVVPGVREKGDSANRSDGVPKEVAGEGGISGVASQMMDAADQRLPTLSVNARRKFFHALAVVMFVPGIAVDPAFTHLSFSVAFAVFNFAEYIRYFALWPFGVSVHLFLNEFLDHKDSGTAILSHFYLLAGCASPLWLEGSSDVMAYFGVLSLGIGDALASIVGRRIGRLRWSLAGGKTVEGSVAFMGSVLVSTIFLWAFGAVANFRPLPYVVATGAAALLEAFSAQNDNLILPMYGWAVGTLLGV